MLIICLYEAVNGCQIQRPGILLSEWNSKKFMWGFF